jgi:hypothetical protein
MRWRRRRSTNPSEHSAHCDAATCVPPEGIEPSTSNLRGRSSATELRGHFAVAFFPCFPSAYGARPVRFGARRLSACRTWLAPAAGDTPFTAAMLIVRFSYRLVFEHLFLGRTPFACAGPFHSQFPCPPGDEAAQRTWVGTHLRSDFDQRFALLGHFVERVDLFTPLDVSRVFYAKVLKGPFCCFTLEARFTGRSLRETPFTHLADDTCPQLPCHVPLAGVEPATPGFGNRCSSFELQRRCLARDQASGRRRHTS